MWFETYWSTVLRQKKWIDTGYKLSVGDICLIADLLNTYGYPTLARISDIENDSYGEPRYFKLEYRKRPEAKVTTIKRTAQSLILVLECQDQSQGQGPSQLPARSSAGAGVEESESAAATHQVGDHLDMPVYHTAAGQDLNNIDHLNYVQMENIGDSLQKKKLKVKYETGLDKIRNMKKS